jgi:hypothetical protein
MGGQHRLANHCSEPNGRSLQLLFTSYARYIHGAEREAGRPIWLGFRVNLGLAVEVFGG